MLKKNEIFKIAMFLTLACLMRIIPHPYNFSPILAICIFSGFINKNIWISLSAILLSLIISDITIGFYHGQILIYLSYIVLIFFFHKKISKIGSKNLIFYSISSSTFFYLYSNLLFWFLSDIYSQNLYGILDCLINGVPFYANNLLSTFLFSYIFLFLLKKKRKEIITSE